MFDVLFDQEYAVEAYGNEAREEGREEGRMEGREEGREEGRMEGREEGREEGRMEGREEGKIAMIKRMMQSLSLSAEKVLEMLAIPKNEWGMYIPKLG